MAACDPEHFSVDVSYRDPLDLREDVPTDRWEDYQAERQEHRRSRAPDAAVLDGIGTGYPRRGAGG